MTILVALLFQASASVTSPHHPISPIGRRSFKVRAQFGMELARNKSQVNNSICRSRNRSAMTKISLHTLPDRVANVAIAVSISFVCTARSIQYGLIQLPAEATVAYSAAKGPPNLEISCGPSTQFVHCSPGKCAIFTVTQYTPKRSKSMLGYLYCCLPKSSSSRSSSYYSE